MKQPKFLTKMQPIYQYMHLSISSVWLIFFILSGVSKCNEIPSNSKDSSEVQTNQNDVNNNLNTLVVKSLLNVS